MTRCLDDAPVGGQRVMETLLGWVRGHEQDWLVADAFGQVLRTTFAQATKTFAAITILTNAGYGADALRLSRSLFESVLVGHWMTYVAEPDWVVARMGEHAHYMSSTWVDILAPMPEWEQPDENTRRRLELEPAERARLSALYGRHAENAWWQNEIAPREDGRWRQIDGRRRSLRSLVDDLLAVDALEGRLWQRVDGEQQPVPTIKMMLEVPQRMNNLLLHHSASGLASYVDRPDESMVFDEGSSESWVPQAQSFAATSFAMLVELMIDRFRPGLQDDLDNEVIPVMNATWRRLGDVEISVARDPANRNRACPCGSGLKSKRCHGR